MPVMDGATIQLQQQAGICSAQGVFWSRDPAISIPMGGSPAFRVATICRWGRLGSSGSRPTFRLAILRVRYSASWLAIQGFLRSAVAIVNSVSLTNWIGSERYAGDWATPQHQRYS